MISLALDPNVSLLPQVRAVGIEQDGSGRILGYFLYRFYDVADRLLYVGITCQIPARWNCHRRTTAWWADVVRVSVECHRRERQALDAERLAIKIEHPLHNKRSVLLTGRALELAERPDPLRIRSGFKPERNQNVSKVEPDSGCIGNGREEEWKGRGGDWRSMAEVVIPFRYLTHARPGTER